MDFNDAIKAHSAWKLKLSNYLAHRDGSLKADEIQVDNRCDLGKWIYSEGAKYGSLPEYNDLKNLHAKFHVAAANVVRKADSGQNVTEEIALGKKSEFSTASTAVVSAIMALRAKIT